MKKLFFVILTVVVLAVVPAGNVFAQTTCLDTGCPEGQICKGNPPTCQVNTATCNPACSGATPICNQASDGTYSCISAAQYGPQGAPGTQTGGGTGNFQFQPIVPLPLLGGSTLQQQTPLSSYVNSLFQLAITVGVVLAVIMIIIDGFKYMTSEAVGNKKDALQGIRSALFGLLIILAATLVLNIINPQLISLNLSGINGSGGAGGGSSGTPAAPAAPSTTTLLPLATPTAGQVRGAGDYCFTVTTGGQICGTQSDCTNLVQNTYTAKSTNPATSGCVSTNSSSKPQQWCATYTSGGATLHSCDPTWAQTDCQNFVKRAGNGTCTYETIQ
ncbi:MAG: hypothetical protein KGI73_02185 [Patescibacteria group bacterium]|nr:hypothetical protein [Patescibacteria group bacterium]